MNLIFFKSISLGWGDCVDIALITLLFYNIISIVKQTRAVSVIYGLLVIILAFFLSHAFGLTTLNWLLDNILNSLFLIVVIVFQKDIRQALSSIGTRGASLPGWLKKKKDDPVIPLICDAAFEMSKRNIGALIVIERGTPLGDIAEKGIKLDALVSKELLINVFWTNAPLHDGACLIRGNRIVAGGCILPLSGAAAKSDYGTRHRAALGITEESDAVVVVVSEERGAVAIALQGKLTSALDAIKLPKVLTSVLERKI